MSVGTAGEPMCDRQGRLTASMLVSPASPEHLFPLYAGDVRVNSIEPVCAGSDPRITTPYCADRRCDDRPPLFAVSRFRKRVAIAHGATSLRAKQIGRFFDA
jgi:hypothetical protein